VIVNILWPLAEVSLSPTAIDTHTHSQTGVVCVNANLCVIFIVQWNFRLLWQYISPAPTFSLSLSRQLPQATWERQFCSVHKTNLHLKPQQLKSESRRGNRKCAACRMPLVSAPCRSCRHFLSSGSCVLGVAAEWTVNEIFMQHQKRPQDATKYCCFLLSQHCDSLLLLLCYFIA